MANSSHPRPNHAASTVSLDGIPGPRPKFVFGNALDFMGVQPWEPCSRYAREYGGLAKIFLGPKPALVVSDPKLIGEVLVDRAEEFHKDAPCAALAPVITRSSLFISNPPAWQANRQSHPLNGLDHDAWHAEILPDLRAVASSFARRWRDDSARKPLDLYWETQRLAFDLFSQAFWGRQFPGKVFHWFQTLARTGSRRMKLPGALANLPAVSPRFHLCRRQWYDSFERVVSHARRASASAVMTQNDLLHRTIRAGTPLSDEALAEALATNFFGGVFSCSSAINTALYHLSAERDELTNLRSVLGSVLSGPAPWNYDALMNCRPLDFVVREALRFYPPVPLYFRVSSAERAVTLGEHTLPPRTLLFIVQWHHHRESRYWGDPESFRPERWEDGVAERHAIGSENFFPFGRGPRMCVGCPFALFFIKLTLATLVLETDPRVVTTNPYRPSFFFGVMMPKKMFAAF